MKKNLTPIAVLLAIGLFIVLGIVLGKYALSQWFTETPNAACAVTMTEIIESAQGDVYDMGSVSDYVEPQSYDLVTYEVQGDKITNPILESVPNDLKGEQKDLALQNEAWKLFTDLIPSQNRQMVTRYDVFTDGYSNTLAAVDQTEDDPSQWILQIDVADLQDKDSLIFTIVHEYAHVLTLNASQVASDQEIMNNPDDSSLQESKTAACPNYFTGTGCSHEDSYIDDFYNRFWVDVNAEWEKIDALQYSAEDPAIYYDALYSFYKAHHDQFVDDYATTHPSEDIAESFAYFVFGPKPTGKSIKEQKIAFFYEYPELVELRANILSSLCTSPLQ